MSHVKYLRQRNTVLNLNWGTICTHLIMLEKATLLSLNLNWGTICTRVEMITIGGMQSEGMLIDSSPTR